MTAKSALSAYNVALEPFPDGVLILDSDRRILYANPAFYRLLHCDPKVDVKGRRCFAVARTAICEHQCLMNSTRIEETTSIQRHSVGCAIPHVGPLCMTFKFLQDADPGAGEPYAMEIFKDMADLGNYVESLRTTTFALAQEKEKIGDILEAIADGYFTTDQHLVITESSEGLLRFLKKRREEVVGKSCPEVFHSDKCRTDCPVKWTLDNGKAIANCRERILTGEDEAHHVLKSTYLLRNVSGEVTGVIGIVRDNSELVALQRRASTLARSYGIVTKNKRMREILDLIEILKDTDTSILILGESGTGKEVVANAIVHASNRSEKPFIKINCSALTETLLESELFGHVKGAFTGAATDKPGKFELADGGTLLLDEVGDMSLSLQAKVLRVLQEKEFERVGASRTRRVDVRIIAATNKNLKKEIEEGRFREDLYYRLHVIPIQIPPLRERKEDIPLLLNYFIDLFNQKYNRAINEVSSRALALLVDYPWPGNIREMRNALEYAFVCSTGHVLERPCLPSEISSWRKEGGTAARSHFGPTEDEGAETYAGQPPAGSGGAGERAHLLETLERCHGNKSKAAKALGIGRTTLWRKLKAHGIEETFQ